jgi:hypothetical protein
VQQYGYFAPVSRIELCEVCKASFTVVDPAMLSKRQRVGPPPLFNFLFILAFGLDDVLVSNIDFLHLDD